MNPTSFSPYSWLGALSQYAPQEPAPVAAPVDSRKTIQSAAPSSSGALGTVGQKYTGSNAPVLDWNTFEQQLLQPMLNGAQPNNDGRAAWAQQLGLDVGGRGSGGIEGFDWGSFANGPSTGNLDDTGMPAYAVNPNAQADRLAAYQKYLSDPNTVYTLTGDAINSDGTTSGGRDYSMTKYKRVGDQLIPINTFNAQSSSLTSDAIKGAIALAGAVYGVQGLEGLTGGAGVTGNGAFLGEGALSGVPSWDAAAGMFPELPGFGTEVATLADAGGGSPFTGFGAEDLGGNGAFLGEDVASGVPAWDSAAGGGFSGIDPYGAGSGWGSDTLSAAGAANDTTPGLLETLKGYGGNAASWLGNVMSGDPKALSQARMGLGAVGLIGQLLQGNQARNQLTPGQLQAAVKGPYDKWTGGNQAAFDKFAGTDLSKFQFTPPKLAHGGSAPHDAHCRCTMCSGGAVSSYARGSLVRGPGGGQDDQVHAMLSPGEYIMDADTVSALGDGDNATGADKLDQMRENIRAHKRSAPPSKIPPRAHAPEHYLHKKGR